MRIWAKFNLNSHEILNFLIFYDLFLSFLESFYIFLCVMFYLKIYLLRFLNKFEQIF